MTTKRSHQRHKRIAQTMSTKGSKTGIEKSLHPLTWKNKEIDEEIKSAKANGKFLFCLHIFDVISNEDARLFFKKELGTTERDTLFREAILNGELCSQDINANSFAFSVSILCSEGEEFQVSGIANHFHLQGDKVEEVFVVSFEKVKKPTSPYSFYTLVGLQKYGCALVHQMLDGYGWKGIIYGIHLDHSFRDIWEEWKSLSDTPKKDFREYILAIACADRHDWIKQPVYPFSVTFERGDRAWKMEGTSLFIEGEIVNRLEIVFEHMHEHLGPIEVNELERRAKSMLHDGLDPATEKFIVEGDAIDPFHRVDLYEEGKKEMAWLFARLNKQNVAGGAV